MLRCPFEAETGSSQHPMMAYVGLAMSSSLAPTHYNSKEASQLQRSPQGWLRSLLLLQDSPTFPQLNFLPLWNGQFSFLRARPTEMTSCQPTCITEPAAWGRQIVTFWRAVHPSWVCWGLGVVVGLEAQSSAGGSGGEGRGCWKPQHCLDGNCLKGASLQIPQAI